MSTSLYNTRSTKAVVRKKILIPILLAVIVTIFSLHIYNQRRAERLLVKKIKLKHSNDNVKVHLKKLHRRDFNLEARYKTSDYKRNINKHRQPVPKVTPKAKHKLGTSVPVKYDWRNWIPSKAAKRFNKPNNSKAHNNKFSVNASVPVTRPRFIRISTTPYVPRQQKNVKPVFALGQQVHKRRDSFKWPQKTRLNNSPLMSHKELSEMQKAATTSVYSTRETHLTRTVSVSRSYSSTSFPFFEGQRKLLNSQHNPSDSWADGKNAKETLNALASIHMSSKKAETTDNKPDIILQKERSDLSRTIAIVTQVPTDVFSVDVKTKRVTKVPSSQIGLSLQQIWDNSLIEGNSKPHPINQRNNVHNMNQKLYSSNKLSLQAIWDESISGITGVVEKEQEESLNDRKGSSKDAEKVLTTSTTRSSTQIKTKSTNLTLVPDINLNQNELPPKSMISKILRFSSRPSPGNKYAVIAIAAVGNDYNYVFTAPLTVQAWRRIGYEVIMFIVGSEITWTNNPILYFILKELRRLDPVVLFLDVPNNNQVFFSQSSRLFASSLFDWRGMEDTMLVTSDSDIWPLTKEMYDLPQGKRILSVNSECCGDFKHGGRTYKLLPMCNIVMSVRRWRQVISLGGPLPTSTSSIIAYFQSEFGDIVTQRVYKGENDGWFLDQHMASVRIAQWASRYGSEYVQYSMRDVGRDRVDRSYWHPYRITSKNDIHLLENLYQAGTWERAIVLFSQMFNEKINQGFNEYRDGFIRMLVLYKH